MALFGTANNKNAVVVKKPVKNTITELDDLSRLLKPDLIIAQKIRQRRLQLLVHSCLYYKMSENLIDDHKFDQFARELVALQAQYPHLAKLVRYHKEFEEFGKDGCISGYMLPYSNGEIVTKAQILLDYTRSEKFNEHKEIQQLPRETISESPRREEATKQRSNRILAGGRPHRKLFG